MSLRTWLLAGTSIGLLAFAPSVMAAPDVNRPALKSAYAAYTADPSDATKAKLEQICKRVGFDNVDDCIAALKAAETGQPAAEPASSAAPPPPPASSEAPPPPPPPPASSEAPPPPVSSEQPAPPPNPGRNKGKPASSSEEPQPAPAAIASSSEAPPPPPPPPSSSAPQGNEAAALRQAVDMYNQAVAKNAQGQMDRAKQRIDKICQSAGFSDTTTCLDQFGLKLNAAPAKPAEQPAAAPPPVAPPPPPASSSVAPAATPPSTPVPPAQGKLAGQLRQLVDQYNQGVAKLQSGDKSGQNAVDRAKSRIDKLCQDAGFPDTQACVAQFGLTLAPLPSKPGELPASSAETAASTPEVTPANPSASKEQPSSIPPISALPQASEAVTPSAVEVLPPDVAKEAAPILDSAKDHRRHGGPPLGGQGQPGQPGASSASSSIEPPPPPAGPPPKDDKSAQANIQPPPPADLSTQTDKGKPKPPGFQFQFPQPPADQPDVKVIQKPQDDKDKGGLVFQIGINLYINNPTQERDRFYNPDHGDKVYYEDLSFGRTRETIVRHDGSRIVTIYAKDGDVLQRSKILPDGREIVLASADPREQNNDSWRDPGDSLPPLNLDIPADDYILDADTANQHQIDFFLDQPPVEQVHQIYTIDDVKRSARLRDMVRRLEVGDLTFDSGKATISRDQVGALANVAQAMLNLLAKNPGEVFLIEGHTDAVGSDVANLELSDQRAATVARILTDFYGIPPENLVTQGYGERYLKVDTQGPEPLNRRVTIKRITPLIAYGQ